MGPAEAPISFAFIWLVVLQAQGNHKLALMQPRQNTGKIKSLDILYKLQKIKVISCKSR